MDVDGLSIRNTINKIFNISKQIFAEEESIPKSSENP
jgi:hypothetical protein